MRSILDRLPAYEGPAFGSYIVLPEHVHSITDVVWRACDDVIRESGTNQFQHPFSHEEYNVMARISAHQLIWVARTPEAAAQFGDPDKVQEIPMPSNAKIFVDNGKGGFLVFIGQPPLTLRRLYWATYYTYGSNFSRIWRDLRWEVREAWDAVWTFARDFAIALGKILLGLLRFCFWPFLSPIIVAIRSKQLDLRKIEAARRGEVSI